MRLPGDLVFAAGAILMAIDFLINLCPLYPPLARRWLIEDARRLDDRLDHLSRAIKEDLIAIDPRRLDDDADRQLRRILTFAINLEQAGDLIDRGLFGIASRHLKSAIWKSGRGSGNGTTRETIPLTMTASSSKRMIVIVSKAPSDGGSGKALFAARRRAVKQAV